MKFLLLAILVTLVSCSTGTGLNPNLERKMDGKTQVKQPESREMYMTTVSDLGMTGIKKGMFFKDPSSTVVDRYEVLTDPAPSTYCNDYVVDILIHYTDNTTATQKWFSYETVSTGWVGKFELMGESEVSDNDKYYWTKYQSEPPKPLCFHSNKKKVIVFNLSGYWYCPDCHLDMGTLTEEEFYQAVKEQTGGKPVKKAPPMGQSRRRR